MADKNSKSIYIVDGLWEQAKTKAGEASLSYVIARLLEMWLSGEVKIIVESAGDKSARAA